MEKYEIDFSDTAHFKGIRVLLDHLEEGVAKTIKDHILRFCVWQGMSEDKVTMDLNFLERISFIQTFHCLVSLTKKSDISGLYLLKDLKELRWAVDSDFDVDLSKLAGLEELNTRYSDKITGWNTASSLKILQLGSVKTTDLSFLGQTKNLEYLRIINGSFSTIKGIETLKKLKTLFLQKCNSLVEVRSVLGKLPGLEQLNIEACKKLDTKEQLAGLKIKHISVI